MIGLVAALIILGGAVDLFLFVAYGVEATISRQVTRLSVHYPVIPFFCGMLAAHFWWPQQ